MYGITSIKPCFLHYVKRVWRWYVDGNDYVVFNYY